MNEHQVWQAALGELRGAMPLATFETWIQNTLAVGQASGRFTIAAPNTFAQEWLDTRFRPGIETALTRVLGRPTELAVVVGDAGRHSEPPAGPAGPPGHGDERARPPAPRTPGTITGPPPRGPSARRSGRSGAAQLLGRRTDAVSDGAEAGSSTVQPRADAAARIWIEDDLLRAGYTECFNVLLPARKIGACDKIVFFGILSFAWQDAAAWPSIDALSARVGLSRRAVLYALAELKRVGLLKVRRRGQGYTNFYEIPRVTHALLERIEAVEPDEADDEPAEDEDLVVVEDLTEAAGVTRLSNLLLTARGLDASDKLVYVGLKSFAMRKAHCRLKMRTLARRIGMSERTVETHIGRLRAFGLITRRRRGLGRANIYTLVRIHPAVLEAIQEPRYVGPPLADDLPDRLVDHCTVCRRPLPESTPLLEAILRCSTCCSTGPAVRVSFPQNGKPCTSSTVVHEPPHQDGNPCMSGSAPSAAPQVPGLPSHAEDPRGEDPNEECMAMPRTAPAVDDPAALVWAAALAELEGHVSQTVFETCFRGTEALSWVENTLTIAAPHQFAREWVDVRYRAEAEDALRRALARVPELRAPELVVNVRRPTASPPDEACDNRPAGQGRRSRATSATPVEEKPPLPTDARSVRTDATGGQLGIDPTAVDHRRDLVGQANGAPPPEPAGRPISTRPPAALRTTPSPGRRQEASSTRSRASPAPA